jgi:hypothetical protein
MKPETRTRTWDAPVAAREVREARDPFEPYGYTGEDHSSPPNTIPLWKSGGKGDPLYVTWNRVKRKEKRTKVCIVNLIVTISFCNTPNIL